MVIKYKISAAPTRLEDMIVKIYEAQNPNPGAEVYTETLPEPVPGSGHPNPYTITANGMDQVVHIVRLYGVTSGELIHSYTFEPKVGVVSVFDPIQFKVGDGGTNTPAANQSICLTPELIGLVSGEFIILRNNYGVLFEGVHYSFNSTTGEWSLLNGDEFGDDEEFTIIRNPKSVSTPVNDSVVAKWFGGFVDISSNTNYSNSHLRKLIRFSGSAQYTFQNTDNVPIGYGFVFNHFGSSGTARVNFLNGDLLWGGSPKTYLDIPQYSEACFVFDGTNWNVAYFVSSSFAVSSTPVANTVLGGGFYNVGDVASGDPQYEITHNLNISGNYLVQIGIYSNNASFYFRNNKIGSTWWHHATDKPNKFWVSLQEISSEVQDVSISWLIIKL